AEATPTFFLKGSGRAAAPSRAQAALVAQAAKAVRVPAALAATTADGTSGPDRPRVSAADDDVARSAPMPLAAPKTQVSETLPLRRFDSRNPRAPQPAPRRPAHPSWPRVALRRRQCH